MADIRAAVQLETQPTRLDRVFLYVTDAALAFVALMTLVLAMVETLPVMFVFIIWAALAVCSYSNHKQSNS